MSKHLNVIVFPVPCFCSDKTCFTKWPKLARNHYVATFTELFVTCCFVLFHGNFSEALPRVCSTTHPTQCRFCFEPMFRGTTIQQNLRMSITCTCAFLRNLTTCITCMMPECAPAAPYKSALHVGAVYVCAWTLPSTVDGFGFLSCVFAEHSNQKEYLFIESIPSEAWPKLFGKVWQL